MDDSNRGDVAVGAGRARRGSGRASWTLAVGVAAVAVLLGLSACSDSDGDGDLEADPVAAAEQRLERAEGELEDATSALDDASARFCDDSAEYIDAVDGYGGVLTDAEATVGAVTTAGADLERPRDEVAASIEQVDEAGADLTAAQEAVVEAQAALDEATTGTTAAPDEDATTTTAPLVSTGTVDRVQRAEDDLDAAFDGVDPSTPLSEATATVNAAAVAVQVAWAQVFSEAGCLGDRQEEVVAAVADHTLAVQTALAAAGYLEGAPDGVYGPSTVEAVERLQEDSGLPVTGLVDRATAEALDAAVAAAGGDAASAELAHTAALQTVLTVAGYWTGPIDGEWTDALTAALQAFQTDLGVEPTGVVDAATIAAAQRALEEATTPDTTTTTSTRTPDDSEPDRTTTTTSP